MTYQARTRSECAVLACCGVMVPETSLKLRVQINWWNPPLISLGPSARWSVRGNADLARARFEVGDAKGFRMAAIATIWLARGAIVRKPPQNLDAPLAGPAYGCPVERDRSRLAVAMTRRPGRRVCGEPRLCLSQPLTRCDERERVIKEIAHLIGSGAVRGLEFRFAAGETAPS